MCMYVLWDGALVPSPMFCQFKIFHSYKHLSIDFKEHKKYFIYGKGRSNLSTPEVEEGHEMKNIDHFTQRKQP
jgi:hypothetical protein